MAASRIKSWLVGFLWLIVAGCSVQRDPDAVLKQVFTEQEIVMVNQIIDYYDTYVWSQTDASLPIEKAYQQFFDQNCSESGDVFSLFPPDQERYDFIKTLDDTFISDNFDIEDTLYVYNPKTNELLEMLLYPYSFNLALDGKMTQLLDILSPRSPFYATYREWGLVEDGVAASIIYIIIYNSYPKNNPDREKYTPNTAQFDFSKKEERLIAMLPFLFANTSNLADAEMKGKYGDNIRLSDTRIRKE